MILTLCAVPDQEEQSTPARPHAHAFIHTHTHTRTYVRSYEEKRAERAERRTKLGEGRRSRARASPGSTRPIAASPSRR